jgi:tetratricopeptide (TPR) repeat protein
MNEEKSDNYSIQINTAWTEYQNNKIENAEALCKALINEYPTMFEPNYLLGLIYFNQENFVNALEQYSISLEKDIDRQAGGSINYLIGELYSTYFISKQKNSIYDTDKAKQHYRKALEYNNYPADVVYQLHHEYEDNYEKVKLYEEGIDKHPNEIAFYIFLSWLYKKKKDPEEEIKILKKALEKGLKSASLFFSVGEYYFDNNLFSESRIYFSQALTLNVLYPVNNYAINYFIANSYYKEGDTLNAERYYRKSFEESKNDETSFFGFFGLIIIYNDQKRILDIQNLIDEIQIDEKIFFDNYILTGGPFWLDSEITESIESFYDLKKISAIFNILKFNDANDLFLGKFWLIKGLLSKCLDSITGRYNAIKKVLKYLPAFKYEFLYTELCSIYSDIFNYKKEKRQDLIAVIKSYKLDLENYSSRYKTLVVQNLDSVISVLFELKLYKDIVEIYRLFKIDQITEAGIWFEIGYSLCELKEFKEAKTAYERHIKIKGETSASLNNLANIYKKEDELSKAIELYKRALELDPNDKIPKNNLDNTLKLFNEKENEKKQKTILDSYFKSALKSVNHENDFVIDKLNKFILNIQNDENFKDWSAPIQKYKFPILMGTDKQKAESLRIQWLNKNYIRETDYRDEHNVIVYNINPYLEKEILKLNNSRIPENWIKGFNDVTIGKLEEIGYFDLMNRIQKTNKKFKPLLERDFNELVFNYIVQNNKATIVLSGSLIELVLLYYCEKKKFNQIPYLDAKGNTKLKKLYDCVLNELIQFADKNLFFGSDFPHLSNLSRIYRNFIHPGRELKDQLDKPKCDLCFISTTEILRKIL